MSPQGDMRRNALRPEFIRRVLVKHKLLILASANLRAFVAKRCVGYLYSYEILDIIGNNSL